MLEQRLLARHLLPLQSARAAEYLLSLMLKRFCWNIMAWTIETSLSTPFSSSTTLNEVESMISDCALRSAELWHLVVHLDLLSFLRIVFWCMFCSWDWGLVTSILGSTTTRTRSANRHGRACASSHARRERHGSARAAIGP